MLRRLPALRVAFVRYVIICPCIPHDVLWYMLYHETYYNILMYRRLNHALIHAAYFSIFHFGLFNILYCTADLDVLVLFSNSV